MSFVTSARWASTPLGVLLAAGGTLALAHFAAFQLITHGLGVEPALALWVAKPIAAPLIGSAVVGSAYLLAPSSRLRASRWALGFATCWGLAFVVSSILDGGFVYLLLMGVLLPAGALATYVWLLRRG
jgi:hypothetical protein